MSGNSMQEAMRKAASEALAKGDISYERGFFLLKKANRNDLVDANADMAAALHKKKGGE